MFCVYVWIWKEKYFEIDIVNLTKIIGVLNDDESREWYREKLCCLALILIYCESYSLCQIEIWINASLGGLVFYLNKDEISRDVINNSTNEFQTV
jgi:hypothetical protein